MTAPAFSKYKALPLETAVVNAPCELCRRVIRMGPVFDGRYVALYDAVVCHTCWQQDRNGWRSKFERTSPAG